MRKKMMKAIKELNDYIDNDREKLCDELHEIKLSHKRMERLLRMVLLWLRKGKLPDDFYKNLKENGLGLFSGFDEVEYIITKIECELSYPYCRVNYRMKGGKNA